MAKLPSTNYCIANVLTFYTRPYVYGPPVHICNVTRESEVKLYINVVVSSRSRFALLLDDTHSSETDVLSF